MEILAKKMDDFLTQMMGKKIDVACGAGMIVRGEVVNVQNGILYMRDEQERAAYVAINKITTVWDVKDLDNRPGFVPDKGKK
jgi:hypothetical protein